MVLANCKFDEFQGNVKELDERLMTLQICLHRIVVDEYHSFFEHLSKMRLDFALQEEQVDRELKRQSGHQSDQGKLERAFSCCILVETVVSGAVLAEYLHKSLVQVVLLSDLNDRLARFASQVLQQAGHSHYVARLGNLEHTDASR